MRGFTTEIRRHRDFMKKELRMNAEKYNFYLIFFVPPCLCGEN